VTRHWSPDMTMKLVDAAVVSNDEVWNGARLMWVRAPDIAALARAGQYVMVRCGDGQEMVLRRPLSVHRVSGDGGVAFLFSVVGSGTEWLAERKPEETLDLLGPLGNGFQVDDDAENLLLVAGGIGIAPLVALAEWVVRNGRSVTLLIGCATAANAYPRDLLPTGIDIVVSTEDCSLGEEGMVTDLLPRFAPSADQVFACGPLLMYRRMAEMGDVLGGKPTQVLLETLLGCGVGACLGCSIETVDGRRLVCKDGPVFDLNEIVWDEMVAPPAGRRYLAL